MNILYCDHNLFLNKKQINLLQKGVNVKVIGINISVSNSTKFDNPDNFKEVFCVYKLICKKDINKSIKKNNQGFNVYLYNDNIKNNFFQKIINIFLNKNIEKEKQNVKRLLELKNGGNEWLFIYEQEFKKNLIVFHKIQIQKIENLYESLI